jgi:mono/diheme cytochrome c family protein
VRAPEGTLNHFTAASGTEIFRGHRLPQDLVGDLLFGEPVARIVRRAKVVVTDGLTQLRNAYPKSEFIRSTDPLFRPVSVHNAPDGTLYLADMYTGIIQDAQFVGAYLRAKVQQYQLDKQHNWGRIWRITFDGTTPDRTQPRMYSETAAQLVRHLEHPSGWWRDTAQKLLVLRQDKSVIPALRTMAASSGNQLARIHALWTLEGLGGLEAGLLREIMRGPDSQMRIQSIRASESLYKAGDKSFASDYRTLTKDADPNVVIQAMLTVNLHGVPDSAALIRTTIEANQSRGVRELGEQMLKPRRWQGQGPALSDTGAGPVNLSIDQRRVLTRGESTYRELCVTCHAPDGKGAPMAGATDGTTLAPSLAGSARLVGHRDYVVKVLLHGLTGPIDGKRYGGDGVMVPMGMNTDEWIADVASYIRNAFGNSTVFVTPAYVASVRSASRRKAMWTMAELEPTIPALLSNVAQWKITASHNETAVANLTADTGRWDTGAPQQPGMWLQIELPEAVSIAEIQIDSAAPPGARGRGGPGVSPAQPPPASPGAARGAATPTAGAPQAPGPPAGGRGRFGGPPAGGPVSYSLQISRDGKSWGEPIAQGPGATPTTAITFRPVPAKFIRITQTGTSPTVLWAVQQVRVYVTGAK